ncbi:hypothetical protein RSAG8_05250, partial [Rhizoctonia solani AG-8 WAC10335]
MFAQYLRCRQLLNLNLNGRLLITGHFQSLLKFRLLSRRSLNFGRGAHNHDWLGRWLVNLGITIVVDRTYGEFSILGGFYLWIFYRVSAQVDTNRRMISNTV